jgi:hypothetical protein
VKNLKKEPVLWIKSKGYNQIQDLFIPTPKKENKIELVKEDLIDNLHRRDKNYLMEKCPQKMKEKKIIQAFQGIKIIIEITTNSQKEDQAVNLGDQEGGQEGDQEGDQERDQEGGQEGD